MPPKIRINKEDIVRESLALIRERGADALNARELAARLQCSTQPIFSNFATMDELQKAVILAAYDRYLDFLKSEVDSGQYPQYKAFGMAYVRFAKEERELFRLLFMRDRTGEDISLSPDYEQSVQMIMKANGISYEKAWLMHFEVWSCVHGIATMLATSFLQLEWEMISEPLIGLYHDFTAPK